MYNDNMFSNFLIFFKKSWSDFLEAIGNLILFFPYFFSVPVLLKTLFSPWKKISSKKSGTGFSIDEWFNRLSLNLISRVIGLILRSSIIQFYFLLQAFFILLLPAMTIGYFLLIPFSFLKSITEKGEDSKKEEERLRFLGTHLLNQENYPLVMKWFEKYYSKYIQRSIWWKKTNLFSFPPIARDWAWGYTPTIDEYTLDLTSTAYQAKIKNIVDREKEIF